MLVDYSLDEIRERAEIDIVKEHQRKMVSDEKTTVTAVNGGPCVAANGNVVS
ncbi:unnamed protein product [Gongylonema pulchrum]|uniref:Uncharacterized protein n=1 Tax=Gongylonema pulchrum TaxID=637853 RepID=A0A3P7NVK7_9BILA|nr:unnamed protein product [Gongylonema pulchrum]